MNQFWTNLMLEIGLLAFLGFLYYFYQKQKLEQYERNKLPILMSFLLQSCLAEKNDEIENSELDILILELDNFLQNKNHAPPIPLLKKILDQRACSPELLNIIDESLKEIEPNYGKK